MYSPAFLFRGRITCRFRGTRPTIHKIKSGVENHELKIIGRNPGNDFQPTRNQGNDFQPTRNPGQVENHWRQNPGQEIRVMIFNLPRNPEQVENHELKITADYT